MTVRSIAAVKTARYVVLGPEDGPLEEVWVICHGYGQLAPSFARHVRAAERAHRLVVVPEALSRFYVRRGATRAADRPGASWMTREAREDDIADTVRYLDDVFVAACARADADPRAVRLGALGFSQGAATAVRWLARSPLLAQRARRADRLVVWGGALPHDLDLRAEAAWLAEADLTLVAGDRDAIATPARVIRQERALTEASIPHRTVSYAGGHRLTDRIVRDVTGPLA
ncbi:MAG: esterase [Bacteroidota bacterium]